MKKYKYLVIVVFVILCFSCIAWVQNQTAKPADEDSPNITTVQYEKYSIKEKQFSLKNVHISYPVFVLDSSPFEESINTLLAKVLLCTKVDQEMLKNYRGEEQYVNNYYDITFANEDIVSILVYTDFMQGGFRGSEGWIGVTWSIPEQRLLRLSDICTWEDLVQCVGTPEDLLKGVPEEKNGQYHADELPSEIRWDSEDDFYLGSDYVGLIFFNRESSKQENWTLEVPFDWNSKEVDLQDNTQNHKTIDSDDYKVDVWKALAPTTAQNDVALSATIMQMKNNTTYQLNLEKKAEPEDCILISIDSPDGDKLQVIEEKCNVFSPYYLDHIVTFDDFNCDGYVDMAVVVSEGAMNVIYQLYVWSPNEEQFLKVACDKPLHDPEVRDGMLVDVGKLGAAEREITYFKWKNEYTLSKLYSEIISLEDRSS